MAKEKLAVFALTPYEHQGEKRTRWTRIGVAFVNEDESISCNLDALPCSGRLQIRKEDPKPAGESR